MKLVIILLLLLITISGCISGDQYIFHEEYPAVGPSKIEHMITHPILYEGIKANGDSSISLSDAYIVWGKLAEPDTRKNRSMFDEFLCNHLPARDLQDIKLYQFSFFAGCSITNNDVLNEFPKLYYNHTEGADLLRNYVIRYGKLESVDEFFDDRGFAQVTEEEDYVLYCLTEAESDTLK